MVSDNFSKFTNLIKVELELWFLPPDKAVTGIRIQKKT